MFRYSIRYRRIGDTRRVYRITLTARDADDARRLAAIRDPEYGSTIESPKRRGAVLPPESADPITSAKARDDMRDGVARFEWHGHDIEVEVV
jgi:hypothetical protein